MFKENIREDGRKTAEFSWTELMPLTPKHTEAMATAWHVALQAYGGEIESPCNPEVRYYKNTDTAGKGGLCWFRRNAVYVETIGNHDFYRPHKTVQEWQQGMRINCYKKPVKAEPMTMAARLPRPRPVEVASRVPRPRPMLLVERPMS